MSKLSFVNMILYLSSCKRMTLGAILVLPTSQYFRKNLVASNIKSFMMNIIAKWLNSTQSCFFSLLI